MDNLELNTEEKVVVTEREEKTKEENVLFSVDDKAQLYYPQFSKEIKRETYMFFILLFVFIIAQMALVVASIEDFDIAKNGKNEILIILGVAWIGISSAAMASVPLIFIQSHFLSKLKNENLSVKELRACFRACNVGNTKVHWTDSMDWKEDALYDLVGLAIFTAVILTIWLFA